MQRWAVPLQMTATAPGAMNLRVAADPQFSYVFLLKIYVQYIIIINLNEIDQRHEYDILLIVLILIIYANILINVIITTYEIFSMQIISTNPDESVKVHAQLVLWIKNSFDLI